MNFVSIDLNIFECSRFLVFIYHSDISIEINVQINNIGQYCMGMQTFINENRKKKILNPCSLLVHGNEMDEFACIDAIEPG